MDGYRKKKMRYIYTVQYYSDTKKGEIMPFPVTGKKLDMMVLGEVSEKD